MSEITKKEFASALKWTWVIVIAAIAYTWIAPNYFFMQQGNIRGNKVTGSIEYLEDNEWVRATESEMARFIRSERKKSEASRTKAMQIRYNKAKELPDDDI